MIELSTYHQGFVSGSFSGLLMGLGLMSMAWEHDERKRRRPGHHRLIYRATAEDAARLRPRRMAPMSWEDPPDPPADLPSFLQRRGSNPPPPSRKPEPQASPPVKPQPSGGRLVRGDRLDPTFRPDWSPCSQPPNNPPSQP